MEKRLGLALVLVFLWFLLFQSLFVRERPAKPPAPAEGVNSQEAGKEEVRPAGEARTEAGPADDEKKETGGEPVEAAGQTFAHTGPIEPQIFEIETTEYRALMSNRGGVLQELKLKKYFTDPDVVVDEEKQHDPGHWLAILRDVRRDTPSFSLRELANARYDLDSVCWEHRRTALEGGKQQVLFTYRTEGPLVFKKTFTFLDGAYHIDIRIDVENRDPEENGTLSLVLDGPFGITDRKRASFTAGPMGVLYYYPGEVDIRTRELKTFPAEKLKDLPDGYGWTRRGAAELIFAGVANNYFALLLKPLEGRAVNKVRLSVLEDSEKLAQAVRAFEETRGGAPNEGMIDQMRQEALTNARAEFEMKFKVPAPEETEFQEFMFFAGPKSTDLMDRPPYESFYALIEDSYGSMAWINKSLIWILKLFHAIFGNWGVAIICLTIVVKSVLFPLNRVQQVSMYGYSEKMKRLKPKLDEIKKKFKNNKKKFNEAQMKMMKEEGVRPPLMGCLLIFLQFPIFIGLFQILRTSFELRHSPFVLWIVDLSQPDALFPLPFTIPLIGSSDFNVLPLLMTVAFYYQQKLMPKPDTSDPQAQQMQKIMRFMPIMFGLLFYGYAAGLSLYWMTSNLISILEYRFIRKKFPVGGKA